MSYVIYNKETTLILRERAFSKEYYATERAAKAALTRFSKKDPKISRDDFAIADSKDFHENIEKMKTVKNLMSGKPMEIPVNTPNCCNPGSETYWSM